MAEPTRVDAVSTSDRPQGPRRRRRPRVHPRDHRRLQHPGSSTVRARRRPRASAPARRPRRRRQRRDRLVERRQLQLGPRPEEGHGGRRRRVQGRDRHRRQDEHRRPQHVPGPDHQLPRRHAGHRLHLVLRLPHEVLRRPGPQRRRSTTSGPRSRATSPTASPTRSSATTARSTASRSTTTRGPSSTARASSPTRATPSRRRGTSSSPCATKMQTDGLTPIAFGDKDGWPAHGHVRHPQPAAQRLRLPRRPDGRQGEVDRPEGHGRLPEVGGVPALPRQGLRRPDLAERRRHARPEEVRACTCSACSCPASSRRPRPADLADLDFFPFPTSGTQFDAENGARRPDRHAPDHRQVAEPRGRARMPPRRTSSSGPRARPS